MSHLAPHHKKKLIADAEREILIRRIRYYLDNSDELSTAQIAKSLGVKESYVLNVKYGKGIYAKT